MTCKKCGSEYEGKVCPNCGTKKPKLTKKQVIIIVCAIIAVSAVFGISESIRNTDAIKSVNSYIENADYAKAKDVLDKEIKENDTQANTYLAYSELYLAQKDYLNATNILEKGLKKSTNRKALQNKLDELNEKYSDKITKQKKDKDEAEKKAAQEKAEQDKKEQEELEASLKEVEKEFKESCQVISYSDLARNPDKYKEQRFKFVGQVIQVIEPAAGNTVSLRLNVTKDESGLYSDTIFTTVTIPDGSDRILEDDILTIYGECEGMYSYESVLNQKISLPKIRIRYYSISKS